MNEVFANRSKEDKIYPLTTAEIAAAQRADASLKHLFKRNAVIDQGLENKLIENTTCVCKDGRLVIPKPLQVCAVKWYHHYLQHPGHTRLEETMNAAMYWKGMRTTIQSLTKSCRSCQVNKRRSQKYGHLPPKTVYTIPWECLCVDLIGPLGWEFRFLVPISGTPIGGGIPIPFMIPKILVVFFFEILISGEPENWNSDL
jgi:hypothetical protein